MVKVWDLSSCKYSIYGGSTNWGNKMFPLNGNYFDTKNLTQNLSVNVIRDSSVIFLRMNA